MFSLIFIFKNADWTERGRNGSVQRFRWEFVTMEIWILAQESAIDMVQGKNMIGFSYFVQCFGVMNVYMCNILE